MKIRGNLIVDPWNNLCRVLEIPVDNWPEGYCFEGNVFASFKMVDRFHPIPDIPVPVCDKETWIKFIGEWDNLVYNSVEADMLQATLNKQISKKYYIDPKRDYLVQTDFGLQFILEKDIG